MCKMFCSAWISVVVYSDQDLRWREKLISSLFFICPWRPPGTFVEMCGNFPAVSDVSSPVTLHMFGQIN